MQYNITKQTCGFCILNTIVATTHNWVGTLFNVYFILKDSLAYFQNGYSYFQKAFPEK